MKVAINFITIIFIFFSQNVFAQIADGNYTYSNNEITFKFTVIENGEKLSNITIFNSVTKKTSNGTGEYRSANNVGWYEVQSAECNYEFDVPLNGKLTLSQFDCKNGQPAKKYNLVKAVINWEGTFKNADNGVLVISNYLEGKSINYKLTYGGTSSCSGTNLSGTAKLVSSNKAVSGVEVDSQTTLELGGNKIVFFPTMEDVGMECQKFFDSDFVRTK